MVLLLLMFFAAMPELNYARLRSWARPTLNVMLMEGDLLTPEACEQVRKASLFPTSVEFMGSWFCFGSILGRFVDYTTIHYTEKITLVHYPMRPRQSCRRSNFSYVKDVFIYAGHSRDGKTKILSHTEDQAYNSEFVQKAITAVELMNDMACN